MIRLQVNIKDEDGPMLDALVKAARASVGGSKASRNSVGGDVLTRALAALRRAPTEEAALVRGLMLEGEPPVKKTAKGVAHG